MVESIMLAYPNLNKPFEVCRDTSDLAIKGIATQNSGKNSCPCFSKKLNEARTIIQLTKEAFCYYRNIEAQSKVYVKWRKYCLH